jgi:hypothetical protein
MVSRDNTGIPERYIADYCSCYSTTLYGSLTDSDINSMQQVLQYNSPLPVEVQDKISVSGKVCMKEMINKMSPSELEQMDRLSERYSKSK